ncbi:MAG: maleylpyruvate isomerase family mycothiol-dependent enzyme [Acidimicrobiales bacterium]|nr:MAG: maleylpyruvate isomerase family mycothiol-dependent enzyme [Acidimicrobiales bacterium]
MSDAVTPSGPLPYDAISHLRTDAVRFLEVITDHGFDHAVPSCPGWKLGDLAWHLGGVWNFWGRVVAEEVTSVDVLRTWEETPRPSDTFLVDWVMAAHTSLFSALAGAQPHQEVWTWTGANRDARWVERRMTQETAVHRWDASNSVEVPYDIPVAVAADGIDEYLTWFAGRGATPDSTPVAGTVHLHCTDTESHVAEGADDRSAVGGEWFVTNLGADGASFTREHAKGDVAIRGRANDLLLWLWKRGAGPVEILGDAAVADRFRNYTDLR